MPKEGGKAVKQYLIIGAALIVILLLNVWQSNFLKQTSRYILTDINEIDNSVKRNDYDSVLKGIDELERTWNSVESGWDIFGEHDDIEQINEHIVSMRVYAQHKDTEELVNEYTILASVINHVIETEQLNFSNVL